MHGIKVRMALDESRLVAKLGIIRDEDGTLVGPTELDTRHVLSVLRTLQDSFSMRLTPLIAVGDGEWESAAGKGGPWRYSGQLFELGTHDGSAIVAEVDGLGFWSSLSLADLLAFVITIGKYMVHEEVLLGATEHEVKSVCYVLHLIR